MSDHFGTFCIKGLTGSQALRIKLKVQNFLLLGRSKLQFTDYREGKRNVFYEKNLNFSGL